MEIRSYKQALSYLEGFIGKVIFRIDKEFLKQHDPLERMRVLLSLLGNPQDKFKSILVGGTSGKGSTSYLVSHILTQEGYKTGFTVSPHLQKINERLQINNKPITDRKFVVLLKSLILPSIRQMSKMEVGAPSYFEILIAMAFTYFAKEKVDIAVVEVGMGGEFDATNTLNPLIAVLTNVGLDHTNILGKTVQEIARTKAGIIKFARGPVAPSSHPMSSVAGSLRALDENLRLSSRRTPSSVPSSRATPCLLVITGVKQPSVIKIVEDKCKEAGAKLYRLHKDFSYKIKKESIEGSVFDLTIDNDRALQLNDLSISLAGEYQVENASIAIKTVLHLGKFGFKISEKTIRKTLSTAFFPGRFEILKIDSLLRRSSLAQVFDSEVAQTPRDKISSTLILDGAHNPVKMKEFLKSLKKLYPKESKIFLIGFKFDKDIPKMLKQITKVADKIIVTQFKAKTDINIHASADALSIKDQILKIKKEMKVTMEEDSKKALDLALNTPSVVVVTGSLYLVGEIRNML